MFYNHEYLHGPEYRDKYGEPTGVLTVPDYTTILRKDKAGHLPIKINNLEYKVDFRFDYSEANVVLVANTTETSIQFWLNRITINTTNANCGSVFISNMNCRIQKIGLGTHFLSEIESWAVKAGYTMIYGNVPKYSLQDSKTDPIHFFTKMGYEQMGPHYTNVRSNNINRWFMKVIQLPNKDDEE